MILVGGWSAIYSHAQAPTQGVLVGGSGAAYERIATPIVNGGALAGGTATYERVAASTGSALVGGFGIYAHAPAPTGTALVGGRVILDNQTVEGVLVGGIATYEHIPYNGIGVFVGGYGSTYSHVQYDGTGVKAGTYLAEYKHIPFVDSGIKVGGYSAIYEHKPFSSGSILVGGYGISTSTISMPQGGVLCGGQAIYPKVLDPSPYGVGSVLCAGEAQYYELPEDYMPTGGMSAGGAATVVCQFGPSISLVVNDIIDGNFTWTTKTVIGGGAIISALSYVGNETGLFVGGEALHTFSSPQSSASVFIGGQAIVDFYLLTPDGGSLVGGNAEVVADFVHTPNGGLTVAGHPIPQYSWTSAFESDGEGVTVGGEAILDGTYYGSGGIEVGGDPTISVGFVHSGTGNLIVGGFALTSYGYTFTPTKTGLAAGGSAIMPKSALLTQTLTMTDRFTGQTTTFKNIFVMVDSFVGVLTTSFRDTLIISDQFSAGLGFYNWSDTLVMSDQFRVPVIYYSVYDKLNITDIYNAGDSDLQNPAPVGDKLNMSQQFSCNVNRTRSMSDTLDMGDRFLGYVRPRSGRPGIPPMQELNRDIYSPGG